MQAEAPTCILQPRASALQSLLSPQVPAASCAFAALHFFPAIMQCELPGGVGVAVSAKRATTLVRLERRHNLSLPE